MKILILTCRFGNGHYSAAKSIQQKLIDQYDEAFAEAIDLQDFYQISPKKIVKDFWRELQNLKLRFEDTEEDILELVEKDWSDKIEEVKIVDVFELAYPEYIDYVYKMYNQVVDKGAKLVNFMYKRSDGTAPSESKAFDFLYNHILGAVTKLLFKENPDIIISAFSICSELISIYKKLSDSTIPLITAITDIYPHSTWINEHTDYYLVAVEETKRQLIQNGVEESSIAVVGMPVSPSFENLKYKRMDEEDEELLLTLNKAAENRAKREESTAGREGERSDAETSEAEETEKHPVKKKKAEEGSPEAESSGQAEILTQKNEIVSVVQKNPYERRLLIMGGGLGMVPSDLDFYKRLNKIHNLKTTLVTGKNKNLYIRLKNRFKNIEVLGFVNNVEELMIRSDLLLTKSGGLTTFEAMYAQLPMAIFKPFLAQEVSNAEFVQRNGFGIVLDAKLNSAEKEIGNIAALLFDKERLQEMKENMKNIVDRIEEDKMLEIIERLRLELSQQAEDEKRNKLHKISRFE